MESGLKLTSNFFKLKLIDDFYLFISDRKIKSYGKDRIHNILNLYLKNKKYENIKINLFGDRLIKYMI